MEKLKNILQPDSVVAQVDKVKAMTTCVDLLGLICWMKSLRQSHDGHFKPSRTLLPHVKMGNTVYALINLDINFCRYGAPSEVRVLGERGGDGLMWFVRTMERGINTLFAASHLAFMEGKEGLCLEW